MKLYQNKSDEYLDASIKTDARNNLDECCFNCHPSPFTFHLHLQSHSPDKAGILFLRRLDCARGDNPGSKHDSKKDCFTSSLRSGKAKAGIAA